MNVQISDHFDAIESRLIASPAVVEFNILIQEIMPDDGKIRIRATLVDGGLLELFEYVVQVGEGLELRKYRFHWQNAGGKLLRRWDNAPHYPDLPNAPHHVHLADGSVEPVSRPPDALSMIEVVETRLLS